MILSPLLVVPFKLEVVMSFVLALEGDWYYNVGYLSKLAKQTCFHHDLHAEELISS